MLSSILKIIFWFLIVVITPGIVWASDVTHESLKKEFVVPAQDSEAQTIILLERMVAGTDKEKNK